MPDALTLTEEETKQILAQREQRERRRWIVEGVFLAADYLRQLGKEAAGGGGEAINPETGKRWAEEFFVHADMISRRGAYLSSNPTEINV